MVGSGVAAASGVEVLARPAARTSLADVVCRALREGITSGRLSPGVRLREVALARHFGVSTTPIREALRWLEREGLVEVQANRGAVVAGFDPREVAHLYEVREVLERRAVRRAAGAPEPRDFARVERLLAEAHAHVDEPDQVAFNRLDVEFHRAVSDLGGNPHLAEAAERVHRQIQGVRTRCAAPLPGRPAVSQAEHQALLSAIQRRDPGAAETLVRAHIEGVRDAVLQVLRTQAHGWAS